MKRNGKMLFRVQKWLQAISLERESVSTIQDQAQLSSSIRLEMG